MGPHSVLPRGFPEVVFKPAAVIGVSIAAAAVFVLLLLPFPRFASERKWALLVYHAPIVMVFVSYGFDRLEHRGQLPLWQWIIEALVVLVSLVRAVASIPYISGHALFLSYVLVTTPFRLAWWLALGVFLEVVYLKAFVWHDPTLIGGALCGIAAGLVVAWGKRSFGEG